MTIALTRLDPPVALPVAYEQAAQFLRLDGPEAEIDLDPLIRRATAAIEGHMRRALISQRYRLTLDAWPDGAVRLPRPPLVSVEGVDVADRDGLWHPVATGSYRVHTDAEPGELLPATAYALPDPGLAAAGIRILFTAGYGDTWNAVPEDIRHAIIVTVASWYDTGPDADAVPPGALALVAGYRMMGL